VLLDARTFAIGALLRTALIDPPVAQLAEGDVGLRRQGLKAESAPFRLDLELVRQSLAFFLRLRRCRLALRLAEGVLPLRVPGA